MGNLCSDGCVYSNLPCSVKRDTAINQVISVMVCVCENASRQHKASDFAIAREASAQGAPAPTIDTHDRIYFYARVGFFSPTVPIYITENMYCCYTGLGSGLFSDVHFGTSLDDGNCFQSQSNPDAKVLKLLSQQDSTEQVGISTRSRTTRRPVIFGYDLNMIV